jgi:hypothetical protein
MLMAQSIACKASPWGFYPIKALCPKNLML